MRNTERRAAQDNGVLANGNDTNTHQHDTDRNGMSGRRNTAEGADLLRKLRAAGGNTVVYSEKAWAVARKSSTGRAEDSWHADSGAWIKGPLTADQMVEWVDDWRILFTPPSSDFARDYRDSSGTGYVVQGSVRGFRWIWLEQGEPEDSDDRWHPKLSSAIRAAADNWEDAGSGGRLAATLRGEATKHAKREDAA